jgi:type II secretory pathway pseudopilin PulG
VDQLTMQRGFSTLEILIAMTILVMCFSATMLLLPGIQDASADMDRANDSLTIAKRTIEEEQAKARKDFKLIVSWENDEIIGPITYGKKVVVESLDYVTKKVTVTVSREGLFGRPDQTTELSTIVTNFEQIVGGDTCDSVIDGENWSGAPSITNRLLGANILSDSSTNYPISDLDAYYGRLYVAVRGTSATPGARTPSTGANMTGVGTLSWNTPGNVTSSNNSYATRSMSGSSATNYLRASNFGFSIPAGATILGIRVDVERSRSSGSGNTNNIRDNAVRIVRANGTVGDENKANTGSGCSLDWSTSDCTVTYGSNSTLWTEEWTAADINDSDFGVALSAVGVPVSGGNNRTAQVDAVTITVTYIPQFYRLSLSTPTNPTRLGEVTTATTSAPVAAGFNAVTVATSDTYGDYAFAAVNSSVAHLQIIDVSGTTAKIISNYQVPGAGTAVANALFFKDGYVYLGLESSSGPEFVVLDVHNPKSIPAPLSSLEIGSGINAIYVEDNLAYLATNDTSRELVIVDLGDLADLPGNADNNPPRFYNASGASPGQGRSLYTVGDTLYLGRYYSSSGHEFMALNTVSSPTLTASADIGTSGNTMGVYGAIVRDTLAFLLTGNSTSNNNGRLQVYNLATMSQIGSVSLPNSGAPSSLECEGDRFYAASTPVSGGQTNKGSISIISP